MWVSTATCSRIQIRVGPLKEGAKDKPLPVVVLTRASWALVPGPQPGPALPPSPSQAFVMSPDLRALRVEHPTPAAAAPGMGLCLPKGFLGCGKRRGFPRVLSPGKTIGSAWPCGATRSSRNPNPTELPARSAESKAMQKSG